MNTAQPWFYAENLHKRFGDQVVLENITLGFEKGRVNGIMGPNGAGKSTCFNLLTGMYKPDRGRIIFDGEDITGSLVRSQDALDRFARASGLNDKDNLTSEFTRLQNVANVLTLLNMEVPASLIRGHVSLLQQGLHNDRTVSSDKILQIAGELILVQILARNLRQPIHLTDDRVVQALIAVAEVDGRVPHLQVKIFATGAVVHERAFAAIEDLRRIGVVHRIAMRTVHVLKGQKLRLAPYWRANRLL
jgi:ABC-type branched-subunit amino acid transport system ATPase component